MELKKLLVTLKDYLLSWQLRNFFSQKINLYIYNLGLKQNTIVTLDYLLSWWLGNCFSKKKKKIYKYNLGLKKLLNTLDDYLLSCGGGGGRVGGGNGNGCGSSCRWLWLLFIVVDILFYYSRYIILLWCLYYFIVLKAKIDSLLQYVCR